MTQHDLYLVGDVEGFTPHIGRLVSMLNYVRQTTLEAVAGLAPGQLDYMPDAQSNSIGALLSHIAAAEVGYQAATFHGRDLSTQEKDDWGAAFALGDRSRQQIRGHDLAYYLTRLEQVRAVTLLEFGGRDDAWLEIETTFTQRTADQQLLQVVSRPRTRDQSSGTDALAARQSRLAARLEGERDDGSPTDDELEWRVAESAIG